MSKVWVTNESSSFAKSLENWNGSMSYRDIDFVNRLSNEEYDYFRQDNMFREKEIDIFDPTLSNMISRSGAKVIIHQLPVTPDKSINLVEHALRNNIEGTQRIIDAAKEARIPIMFITSKNYSNITSNYNAMHKSDIYDITALTVEHMLDASGVKHTSIIPPILYGPEFDEGISGLIKTSLNKKEKVVLNLDPEKLHPFMYSDDFFDALQIIVSNIDEDYGDIKYNTIQVHPHEKVTASDILDNLQDRDLYLEYEFHPENDYLEYIESDVNEMIEIYKWRAEYKINEGLDDVIEKMRNK